MTEEDNNTTILLESSVNPFDDPIQRTKYLIRYIRLRKQRAEGELAKRNALKKQKKDAQATLKNAREGMKDCELEINRYRQRLEEFGQSKHELLITLKSIINRETERKKKREAAEEENRLLAEKHAQQAAAEHQQFLQQATLEAFLVQNLKNPNFLNSLSMSNRLGHSGLNQMISSVHQPQVQINNPTTNPSSSSPAPQAQRFTPFTTTASSLNEQTNLQQQIHTQQLAQQAAVLQSQQQNTALAALIRQQLLVSMGHQPSGETQASNSLISSGMPSATNSLQFTNDIIYQNLLATLKTTLNPPS